MVLPPNGLDLRPWREEGPAVGREIHWVLHTRSICLSCRAPRNTRLSPLENNIKMMQEHHVISAIYQYCTEYAALPSPPLQIERADPTPGGLR